MTVNKNTLRLALSRLLRGAAVVFVMAAVLIPAASTLSLLSVGTAHADQTCPDLSPLPAGDPANCGLRSDYDYCIFLAPPDPGPCASLSQSSYTTCRQAAPPAGCVKTSATSVQCKDGTVVPLSQGAAGVGAAALCKDHGGAPADAAAANPAASPTDGSDATAGVQPDVQNQLETACGVKLSIKIDGNNCLPYNKCNLSESSTDPGCTNLAENPIIKYLKMIINVMSAGVGVVVAMMIVIGGIQLSTSRDNPQAQAAAIARIYNALLALVLYALGYALLNFLIPGGLIG